MHYPLYAYAAAQLDRPTIVLGYGNGFPAQVYTPLAAALGDEFYRVGLPARSWWTDESPETFQNWHQLADDFVGGIREHNLAPVIAVGHSMSGVAFMYAAVKHPELFKAVIMLDPVLLPPALMTLGRIADWFGMSINWRLEAGALKRRREWTSFEDAYSRFRQRPLFSRCSDEVVRLYTEGMTRVKADGSLELAYPPEWEARIFRQMATDGWGYLRQLNVPTLLLMGAESGTFFPAARATWQRKRPDFPLISIPETGHLLPFEKPQEVADYIRDFVAKLP